VLPVEGPVSAVKFDSSGLYLSIAAGSKAGNHFGVRTHVVKDWTVVSVC
jgi:hypothetical protein